MKTKSVGEILKEEREYHRLSLDEVSKRTRIRVEYLRALESNQFDQVPAATFVKGYIRSYGQLFGFDHQPLLGLLRRDYRESARGKLIPREFIKPVLKRRVSWTPVSVIIIGVVTLFVSLLSYVGWQWYLFSLPPKLQVSEPAAEAVVGPQVVVAGTTSNDATVFINAQPVPLQPDGSFSTTIYVPLEGTNTITIESRDRRGKTNRVQRSVVVQF